MIKIGTQFRYSHADGNPTWTVTEKRGRGTWIATVLEDVDWKGTRKAFSTEEITHSLGFEKVLQKSMDDSDTFFNRLAVGSVVHYNNGGNQYVRCQVTSDHQLLPIALVGEWREHELPKRQLDGEIYLGYHAKNIQEKKSFRPHASNVYEYNLTKSPNAQPIGFARHVDPRQLTPLMLTVPTMTFEQEVVAVQYQKLKTIRTLVQQNLPPAEIFGKLKELL